MKRRAYKFVVTAAQREELESEVGRLLGPDPDLDATGRFRIVTQYFDSPDRDCYWQRVRKMKSRKKIRVRYFDMESTGDRRAVIDVKAKRGRAGGERGVVVPVEVAESFVAGDPEPLRGMLEGADRGERMVIHEVVDMVQRLAHEPSVRVAFDRAAYRSADTVFRINFDSNVVCGSGREATEAGGPGLDEALLEAGESVVEVTSLGPVPNWFRDCINQAGLERRGFSKYSCALQRADPVLRKQLSEPGTAIQ